MDENVAKAVMCELDDLFSNNLKASGFCSEWLQVRARLVELEAENERLRADCDLRFKQAMQNGQSAQVQRARAGKAEALLRELTHPNAGLFPDLVSRITAHLSENGHG